MEEGRPTRARASSSVPPRRASPLNVKQRLTRGGERVSRGAARASRPRRAPSVDLRALLEEIIEELPLSRRSLEIIYPTPASHRTPAEPAEQPSHPLQDIFCHYCQAKGKLRTARISLQQLFDWFTNAQLLDGKLLTGTHLSLAFNQQRQATLSLAQLDEMLVALCQRRSLREAVLRNRLRDAALTRKEMLERVAAAAAEAEAAAALAEALAAAAAAAAAESAEREAGGWEEDAGDGEARGVASPPATGEGPWSGAGSTAEEGSARTLSRARAPARSRASSNSSGTPRARSRKKR